METQQLYNISLIASFIAGMVALFAPCCISYLLPTYFANIFKERKYILLMTLVYSLGIFIVMMPVVLGARTLAQFFFRYHDITYLIGGLFLIVISQFALLGIKFPMPQFSFVRKNSTHDIGSTFTLGIISGITSACCAPVLLGIVTLSALSPTIISSLGVGSFYVLGMVAPLYVASIFIQKGNILEKPFMKRKVADMKLFGKEYPIFIANIVASIAFFLTGSIILILLVSGRLGMPDGSVPKVVIDVATTINSKISRFKIADVIFVFVSGILLYVYIKKAFKK